MRIRLLLAYVGLCMGAFCCVAASEVPPFHSVSFSSISYYADLPEPFGKTVIEVKFEQQSTIVASMAIRFGGRRYVVPYQLYGDLRRLGPPEVSIEKDAFLEQDHIQEFQVWFEYGDETGYRVSDDVPGCGQPCYVYLKPVLVLTIDDQGGVRVERKGLHPDLAVP